MVKDLTFITRISIGTSQTTFDTREFEMLLEGEVPKLIVTLNDKMFIKAIVLLLYGTQRYRLITKLLIV